MVGKPDRRQSSQAPSLWPADQIQPGVWFESNCFQFQPQWIYNVYYTYMCTYVYMYIRLSWMKTCLHSVLAVVDHGAILKADLAGQERSCQVSSKQPIQTKCWAVKITLEVELRFRVLAFWHPDFNCSILANLEMVILSFALTVLISLHLPSLSKASGSEDSFVTLTIPWQPRLMMIEYKKDCNRAKIYLLTCRVVMKYKVAPPGMTPPAPLSP